MGPVPLCSFPTQDRIGKTLESKSRKMKLPLLTLHLWEPEIYVYVQIPLATTV